MADEDRVLARGAKYIDFQTDPSRYRHWKLDVEGDVATLTMDVDENGGLFEGYQLKLNSYDLGVDIELADAVQRLRFEHPGVKVVLLRSGKNRVFCAGANIRMLAGATHAHKVNFCKFTNETRNGLEDSSENSGQRFVTVIIGTAAGGGYVLALATDYIILADDGAAAVALPEVPLLAVLPGTGGLTRVLTSARCAAITPIFSAPSRKASRASARCNGAWSTRSCRTASSKPKSPSARRNSRPPRSATATARALRFSP